MTSDASRRTCFRLTGERVPEPCSDLYQRKKVRTKGTPKAMKPTHLAVVATALISVLQVLAQRVVPAYLAALIFVLEPVFAAVFAYLIRGETLGILGWLGGGLIVVAMLISEVRWKRLGVSGERKGGEQKEGQRTVSSSDL